MYTILTGLKPRVLVLISLTIAWSNLWAQHLGPSLTASTSKVAFQQGALDTELIAEIIATKQEEIKKELMNRTVLNCLECGSFTTWNYARQSLDVLLNERDVQVITKEMLRYTTEMAVVMGVSEFYLQLLGQKSLNKTLNMDQKKFLLQYFKWMDVDSKRALAGTFINIADARSYYENSPLFKESKPTDTTTNNTGKPSDFGNYENPDIYYEILTYYSGLKPDTRIEGDYSDDDMETKSPGVRNKNVTIEKLSNASHLKATDSKYLPEVFYLKRFNNKNYGEGKALTYNKGLNSYCDAISPNHILIDMVYEVCKNNPALEEYGFFQNDGVSDSTYKYKNKYTIFWNKVGANYGIVKPEIDSLVSFLFESFSTIRDLYQKDKKITLSDIQKAITELGSNTTKLSDLAPKLLELNLDSINANIDGNWSETIDILTQLALYKGDERDNELLYYVREKVKPAIAKLDLASAKSYKEILKEVDAYEKHLQVKALSHLEKGFRNLAQKMGQDPTEFGLKLDNFIQLVNTVNSLDDPLTYDVIAKFIIDIGEIFGDSRAQVVLNRILNDFDKYLIIDKEEEQLTLNVEDIAVDLYTQFGESQRTRVAPYFTVGMNQSLYIPSRHKVFTESDTTLQNLYYASEKIGIKWNIIDRNKNVSFGAKSQSIRKYHKHDGSVNKPILTNLHSLIYVSGLLYQVDFLNSEDEEFKSPIVGIGVGLGFFNGLDLNLVYSGLPARVTRNINHGVLSLAFDIQITEYLSALKKKGKGAE